MAKRKEVEKEASPRTSSRRDQTPRTVSLAAAITVRDVGVRVKIRVGRRVRSMLVTKAMVGRSFGVAAATWLRSRGGTRAYQIVKQSQRARGVARADTSAVPQLRPAKAGTSGDVVPESGGRVEQRGMILQEILVPTVHHGVLRMRVTADGTVRVVDRPRRARTVPASAPLHESSSSEATAQEFTTAQMLEAGLLAFREIADRWKLSNTEQCAMLQVSDSTRLRWTKSMPTEGDALADRLQLILLSYQRANELAGSESEAAALVRREGSALNAESPQQTILEMLSVPSILEMNRHYQRLEAEVGAW